MELNTSLSKGQASFVLLLESEAPYLSHLFDFEERAFLPEKVDEYLGVSSHSQAIMARFFLSVWRHSDDFEFNFIEAARVLDDKQMNVIINWFKKPLWP